MSWTNATKNTAVYVPNLAHGSAAILKVFVGLLGIYTKTLSHYGEVTAYTGETKNTANYTEESKNSATYSNQTKNSATYSNVAKN